MNVKGLKTLEVSLFGQESGGLVVFFLFLVHLGMNFLRHHVVADPEIQEEENDGFHNYCK